MKRAAIYARFSSDLQRDRSIEDQAAVCRDYAARQGIEIVAVFSDRAMTGSTMHQRAGIKALLAAARTNAFDMVIAESMSRIGRDQEDRAAVRKRLTFCSVQLMTPADGVVAPLVDGIRAVIDSAQLDDMKSAIRRGMRGTISDGRHPGGKAYGYRAVPGRPGELEIVADQAEIVRRIFSEYVAGDSARDISARLNADNIAPPRGAFWRAATITGHTARSTGILQNRLYCGEIIWNRAHTPRDPDTFRRVRRAKPEADWQRAAAPQLRIIDDATFQAAQLRRQTAAKPRNAMHRPKRLLSGLLRCGSCGAGMSIKDRDGGRPRIVCSRMKEAGACSHRRAYHVDAIEQRVIEGLRSRLGSREALAHFIRCYNDERQRTAAEAGAGRAKKEARLATLDRQIGRAVQQLIEERITEAEAEQLLPGLRAERTAIAAELQGMAEAPKVVALHPAAVTQYLRDLERLDQVANADLAAGDAGAAEALRALIVTVTVMPAPAGERPALRVAGHIERLLGLAPLHAPAFSGGDFGAGGPFHSSPPADRPGFFTFELAA